MSSASSASLEWTRSSNSFSDGDLEETLVPSECATTDIAPKGGGQDSSLFLTSSNAAATTPSTATAAWRVHASSDEALLHKERIHRYIDRCLPPALVDHQRATDGNLIAELCEALVQLGGPEVWATRLPTDVLHGSVLAQPVKEMETVEAKAEEGPSEDSTEGYRTDDAALTWEEDLRSVAYAETLPVDQLPWASLARHLHQLTTRLSELITQHGQRGGAACYTLPFRLQARVTPVLYAWATCWRLAEADIDCWVSVARVLLAACGAHPPPPPTGRATATAATKLVAAEDAASPANAVLSPASTGSATEAPYRRAPLSTACVRYTFTLPWKPLASLFLAVHEPSNTLLPSWAAVVAVVRRELPTLCRRASPFFSPDAVEGLWGLVCRRLQRSPSGAEALSLFVHLVPYRHLCTPETSNIDHKAAEEKEKTGSTTAPHLTARAAGILRFLLVETATWTVPAPSSSPASGHNRNRSRRSRRRGAAPLPLLLSWRAAVAVFVGSLARAHPALADMDAYAEPLFTALLIALSLPIGSSAGMVGASAAAAASRVVRGIGAPGAANGVCDGGGGRGVEDGEGFTAVFYVQLLSAFPDNTDSSLWRQLERWIHATAVLVRPGLPCTPGSASARACACYEGLAREALRRVSKIRDTPEPRSWGSEVRARSSSAASSAVSDHSAAATPSRPPPSSRYWSVPSVNKFVQIFLPLAISAFQTRAASSVNFLVTLLALSPTIVLPALLACVDAGLHSPTEVAAQRRIAAKLLLHTVVTVFTDSPRQTFSALRSVRATVSEYVKASEMLWLSLVSASTPDVSSDVLTLLGVAVTYIPAPMLMESPYEAEALGAEYAARVVALFTESETDKPTPPQQLQQAKPVRQKHIEAFITALPASARALVTSVVLKESHNRDYGQSMCPLVRMIAVVSPAEAWRFAQLKWLPVLVDAAAGDAEVRWAGDLLVACLLGCEDRSLVRRHAADILSAVNMQLRYPTSRLRRGVAVGLVNALVASLLRPRCDAAPENQTGKELRNGGVDGGGRSGEPASTYMDEGSPLSDAPLDSSPAGGGGTARIGSATTACVRVEWPTAEEDIRTCVDFFNASVRDVVRLIKEARQIRACSPATAAAVDSPSLAERFLPPATTPAPRPPSAQQRCASESAAEITPHNVVEGALEWLGRLLEIFEWLYAVPSPPATIHTDTPPNTADTAARRGVCWRDVNHRSAWWPGREASTYKPAYSRAALFEVVYKHLCLPLVDHHVVKPLRTAGVKLRPVLAPLLGLSETVAMEEEESASDGVVEWGSVCGVLRWLVLSGIDCPQLFWLPRESSYRFWSRVVKANPAGGRRASLPWAAWASRALLVHVNAAVAGYLPVSQDTLSRTVALLQCLTLSPQKTVRTSSLRILVDEGLLSSLDATSLALFVRCQRTTTSAVLTRWHAVTNATTDGGDGADGDDDEGTAAGSGGSSSRSALHTVQESISGTLHLFAFMSLRRLFVRCPWTELNVLTSLLTFPEVLRSTAATTLLSWMQRLYERNPSAKPATVRCVAYMEVVVRLASALVATHPVRTIFLLTLARSLYWPTPGTWLSLPVLRLLVRLTVSPHVAVRSRATELLSAVAVHVAMREPLVPVCLLPSAVEKGKGVLLVPNTFVLTPAAVTALDAAARALHDAQVQDVQSSLSRLSAVLPVLPSYLDGQGQLFPMCVLSVPQSAAEASGLPRPAPENFVSAQGSCVETPNFLDALAVATCEVPEDAMALREQWDELLVGTPVAAAAIPSSLTQPPQNREPTDTANTATSWAVRMLTLPIERPMPGAAPEARPSCLVQLLASVACASPSSLRSVAALLAWVEGRLRQWEAAGAARRDGAVRDVENSGRGCEDGGRGARHVEEDELYRLFLPVLTVAAAVVQLTTPPRACEAHADLRSRALRLFTAVLMCLCSHAAVPHAMMESLTLLGIDSVKRSLSVEETWAVLSSVLEEPRGVAAATDIPTAAATAAGAQDGAEGDGKGGGDVWSQRQLRLLTVAFTLLSAAPGIVKCALLSRLTALVSRRGRVFFMSPSDQVRRCASRLLRSLLVVGAMQSGTLIECTRCYPTGRALLAQLLEKVNAQVFRGALPFTTTTATGEDVREEGPASTAAPFVPATSAAAGAPAPSLFTASSAEDIAVLTATALTLQAFPVDVYVDSLDDVVMLLCYSLDLSFTKVQHLHDAADIALLFVVTSSMPKPHAHRLLQHLCAICLGEVPYGVSRRAKAACTRALKATAFRNLHRIGKYAMMLQVGDAALASLASRDISVRGEGSQLFAVLTKVASEAQTRVMMQALGTECRMLTRRAAEATYTLMQSQRASPLPHTQSAPMTLSDLSSGPSSPTPSSPAIAAAAAAEECAATVVVESVANQSVGSDPANTRRMAVVQALGAAVLADPGTPSPYVPKLMEALASCAREGNTEYGRFAKRVFEQWWHAHREGWEQEYKKLFSAEQIDAMSDLLLAPRYYA